jgi:hypothetical protein
MLTCFTDCILVRCWLLFHWMYFASMLTCFTDCILIQCWLMFHWHSQHWTKIVNETIVNIESKYSQWSKSTLKQNTVSETIVNCWLLFHWLCFGSILTIVSLTVSWFNVDYCFIDCILVQCWLLFHWLHFASMVNIEPKYSQWNNSQHRTKIQAVKQ